MRGGLLEKPDQWRLVEACVEIRTLRFELPIVLSRVRQDGCVVNDRIGLVVGTVICGRVGTLTRGVVVRRGADRS
jgi:hypothetical protein